MFAELGLEIKKQSPFRNTMFIGTLNRRARECLLAAAAVFMIATGGAQPAVTLTVGPNINISKSSANNAEECIAINPRNLLNLFASETWSLMTRYSLDG